MIVSRLSQKAGKIVITPDVTRNVGNVDTFYLFYYVYKNNDDEMIDVNCNIYDNDKKQVFTKKEVITAYEGNIFQNQMFVAVPTTGLAYGKYTVEINASSKNSTASEKTVFENQSYEFPLPLSEVDELIDQLQYIAKDEEMEYMRDGKTVEERQKRFLEFWKKQDPSTLTKRNEVMQEYYRRLFIANKSFSTTYVKGWRTDMGMVYIIFGAPSNIDKHPFDQDSKPYEIWEYYDINKEFVFIDNTGFGDYRLITPIWETFRYQR
jgi:GWxTD domain-containing protein